jgi:hypothetical protein
MHAAKLLAEIDPELDPKEYVFCTGAVAQHVIDGGVGVLGAFTESEGPSVIVERAVLSESEPQHGTSLAMRRIVLTVHSSLTAVGITASVSGALADAGISANVVAAFHHDHLFVPAVDAESALRVLVRLQSEHRAIGKEKRQADDDRGQ